MTDAPLEPPQLDVTILLADSAQVADGKLYILGGGLSVVGTRPQPMAIALRISVPWDRANIAHQWQLTLQDEDGQPVTTTKGPLAVSGRFEAGRPAGLRPGTPLSVPLAINFPALPITPGTSYSWQLTIDDETRPTWRAAFTVRGTPASN